MEARGTAEMPWLRAIVRAAIVLVVSVILFVIVPDRLLAYLSLHLVPFWRDLVMLVYVAAAFIAGCVVFVRLQRVHA
ncbi:MAG TPA: hypothetical protein VK646_00930 [Actinomycetota bacterium]|nr:hypothetical protein [Actinomycetota bacterium]